MDSNFDNKLFISYYSDEFQEILQLSGFLINRDYNVCYDKPPSQTADLNEGVLMCIEDIELFICCITMDYAKTKRCHNSI